MIVRCVYASRAATALTSAMLEDILERSRINNPANGITGILCYSGDVFIQVLEGESAIAKNRELMGATDPKKAAPGTIRADFAASIDANSVHGSDGSETARAEIAFFFPARELFSR